MARVTQGSFRSFEVVHEETADGGRWRIEYGDGVGEAELSYRRVAEDRVSLDRMALSKNADSQGEYVVLLGTAADWGRANGAMLTSACPHILKDLRKSPHWRDVVADD